MNGGQLMAGVGQCRRLSSYGPYAYSTGYAYGPNYGYGYETPAYVPDY